MSKKVTLLIICIYLFIYFLNYLTPLSFGDDYVYSFIWSGHSIHTPLPETVERVSGVRDILVSQWSHYFTGNGRISAHLFVQFFTWQGKDIFNIANSLVFVLLILEIYWISARGNVSLKKLKPGTLWGLFVSLWAFTPGFNPVFLWLAGACNYPWMAVFLLGFLTPYVRKFYSFHENLGTNSFFSFKMFALGVITGCGNENSVCWIILVLLFFLSIYRKCKGIENWMYFGFMGLVLGYLLLMFAPGNMVLLHTRYGSTWLNAQTLQKNLYIISIILMFQFLMWYFCLKSIVHLSKADMKMHSMMKKDVVLVKILCCIAFGMTAIMLLSPSFSPRNGFPGTVQLIIAASILLRIQNETGVILIPAMARKFMFCVGILFFLITSSVTIPYSCEMKEQMDALITKAKQTHTTSPDTILTVKQFKGSGKLKDLLSGYHLSYYDLSEDANNWVNIAFARYYGIKGIRMVKESR